MNDKTLKVLVTAGNTLIPIDQVRAITNIFKGRTGTNIARHFARHSCEVTLLTSNPELYTETIFQKLSMTAQKALFYLFNRKINPMIVKYRTFDDLEAEMKKLITTEGFDIIIHSAAVSDYFVSEVCLVDEKTEKLVPIDKSKKISSEHAKLCIVTEKTAKLVDKIRTDWGYGGKLVKFKLQVGISDHELLAIARKSMADSDADAIVANCLEWSHERAYILHNYRTETLCIPISRTELARRLYGIITQQDERS